MEKPLKMLVYSSRDQSVRGIHVIEYLSDICRDNHCSQQPLGWDGTSWYVPGMRCFSLSRRQYPVSKLRRSLRECLACFGRHLFCLFLLCSTVQNVKPNSPSSQAGLISDYDYIVGTEAQHADLSELIQSHNMKPLRLHVYNSQTDVCREVTVTPNDGWGGDGRFVLAVVMKYCDSN
jgi:hypothetical protein